MAGNWYVKVYRDALDCWLKLRLRGSEWAVLMYLAGAIWGWHRVSTKKSLGEIADKTGISRKQVLRAIKRLEKAGLVITEGQERRKQNFRLRPPGEYTVIEAKLVTKMTPDEAKPIESENLVTKMAKSGDKDDTNLVTRSRSKLQSPYKPLNKEIRKKERDDDTNNNSFMKPTVSNFPSLKDDNPAWRHYLSSKSGQLPALLRASKLYQLENNVILAFKYPLHKQNAEKKMESVQAIVAAFIDRSDAVVQCVCEGER